MGPYEASNSRLGGHRLDSRGYCCTKCFVVVVDKVNEIREVVRAREGEDDGAVNGGRDCGVTAFSYLLYVVCHSVPIVKLLREFQGFCLSLVGLVKELQHWLDAFGRRTIREPSAMRRPSPCGEMERCGHMRLLMWGLDEVGF